MCYLFAFLLAHTKPRMELMACSCLDSFVYIHIILVDSLRDLILMICREGSTRQVLAVFIMLTHNSEGWPSVPLPYTINSSCKSRLYCSDLRRPSFFFHLTLGWSMAGDARGVRCGRHGGLPGGSCWRPGSWLGAVVPPGGPTTRHHDLQEATKSSESQVGPRPCYVKPGSVKVWLVGVSCSMCCSSWVKVRQVPRPLWLHC